MPKKYYTLNEDCNVVEKLFNLFNIPQDESTSLKFKWWTHTTGQYKDFFKKTVTAGIYESTSLNQALQAVSIDNDDACLSWFQK